MNYRSDTHVEFGYYFDTWLWGLPIAIEYDNDDVLGKSLTISILCFHFEFNW